MANNPQTGATTKALQALESHIKRSLGKKATATKVAFNELTVTVQAAEIVSALTFLRDDDKCRFTCIIDICGVDYPQRAKRFDVVYHLLSPSLNQRLRVKLEADAETPVPSVVEVFPGANWYERETYDLFGVVFDGHPDLRRILTDYGFEGFPLRKDFPLSGYVEVRYDESQARIVYEPVNLPQEFRNFDFTSPWEGPHYVLPGDEKAKS